MNHLIRQFLKLSYFHWTERTFFEQKITRLQHIFIFSITNYIKYKLALDGTAINGSWVLKFTNKNELNILTTVFAF